MPGGLGVGGRAVWLDLALSYMLLLRDMDAEDGGIYFHEMTTRCLGAEREKADKVDVMCRESK